MKIKKKDVIVIGFALFSMFFGAGNLIFPPYLGLLSADKWTTAALGFIITAVGLTLLTVVAATYAGGSLQDLTGKLGKRASSIISTLVIIFIGPLLAIPRNAATSFEVIFSEGTFSPALFSLIFFALVLVFCLKDTKLIDTLGKFLTPILLIAIFLMIIKGVSNPIGDIAPASSSTTEVFSSSLAEGYQTMDLLAAAVYTTLIMQSVVKKGYTERKSTLAVTIRSSIVASILLAVIYAGLSYLGSTMSVAITDPNISRTVVLREMASMLFGNLGSVILAVAISLACLTTAVGLTSSVSIYFENMFKGKVSYQALCVITSIIGFIFATVGVEGILMISAPILVVFYPIIIVLVVLNLLDKHLAYRSIYQGAAIGALIVSIFQGLVALVPLLNSFGMDPNFSAFENMAAALPFNSLGFPWILPAVLGGLIGYFYGKTRKVESN